jgi:hypothetical protein
MINFKILIVYLFIVNALIVSWGLSGDFILIVILFTIILCGSVIIIFKSKDKIFYNFIIFGAINSLSILISWLIIFVIYFLSK